MNVSVASLLTPQCLDVSASYSLSPIPTHLLCVCDSACVHEHLSVCVCVCVHGIMINSCFWTLPDYRGVFKPVSNGSSLLGRPALLHLPTCTQGSLHTYIHIKMHTCILTWTHTHARSSHNWGGGCHSNPVVSVEKWPPPPLPRPCQEANIPFNIILPLCHVWGFPEASP